MKYRHLGVEEREIIQKGLWNKRSIRDIAKELSRSPSSISREINKNIPLKRSYKPRLAQARAQDKRKSRGRILRLKNGFVRRYVVEKLKKGYSPEQISGRLSLEYPDQSISHEAIYQYVYNQVYRGGHGYMKPHYHDLRQYLKRRHKRRQRKGMRKSQRIWRPKGLSIDLRPQRVERRKEIGHWEGDSVESIQKKAGINTLVERKTGMLFISRLGDRTSEATTEVVSKRLNVLPQKAKQTITLDNGPENQYHQEIKEKTGAEVYYTHPYSSWERGSNENTNGLIRWYLPKGTDFDTITNEELKVIEWSLNNRPRKRLGFLTPLESFNQELFGQEPGVAVTG
jgi:transposase, IS30 family